MRKTAEEAEQTRRALLDAALLLFGSQGYERTRLQDVAASASVTRGAIYHHFATKADLYTELIKRGTGEIDAQVAALTASAGGGGSAELLGTLLDGLLRYIEGHPRFRALAELIVWHTGTDPELAECNRFLRERRDQQIARLSLHIQACQASGSIRPELPAKAVAEAFLAYSHGLHRQWLMYGGCSLAEHAGELASMFLQGISKKA